MIFAHIFASAVLGLVLARIIGDTRFILVCIVGSILPEFIDKPPGYLILLKSLDSGTTNLPFLHYCHNRVYHSPCPAAYWHTPPGIAVACMFWFHQIMDEMWRVPVTWSLLLTGPFQPIHYANFFETYFWRAITAFRERIFLFSTLLLLWRVYSNKTPGSLIVMNHERGHHYCLWYCCSFAYLMYAPLSVPALVWKIL